MKQNWPIPVILGTVYNILSRSLMIRLFAVYSGNKRLVGCNQPRIPPKNGWGIHLVQQSGLLNALTLQISVLRSHLTYSAPGGQSAKMHPMEARRRTKMKDLFILVEKIAKKKNNCYIDHSC